MSNRIHWEVCKKFDIVVTEKWYECQPKHVMENESSKILSDFSVQIDDVIEARCPNLIVINKAKKQSQIIDFVVPFDSKVVGEKRKKTRKVSGSGKRSEENWKWKYKSYHFLLVLWELHLHCCQRDWRILALGQELQNSRKLPFFILPESSKKCLRFEKSCWHQIPSEIPLKI